MKKGFTLAETLITLAIIGIVAAVVTPILINNQPNIEMLKFKKAYALTEKIVMEIINDESLYPDDRQGLNDVSAARYENQTYRGTTKFCGLFAAKLGNTPPVDECPTFTTTDGIQWTISRGNFAAPITITIDVDGPNRGENSVARANSEKPDQFSINVNRNGRVSTIADSLERLYVNELDNTKKFKDLRGRVNF